MPRQTKTKKALAPTGIAEIDRLAELNPCSLSDYIGGVSSYVRQQTTLSDSQKKSGQIRLSNALARSLARDLESRLPTLKGRLVTDERTVAGGLRTAKADVSESHELDGLRLAVELKPVNLAVGRAIWNRFGDIRTFAVNIHLKFPFAVVGGVLVIPTYEEIGTNAAADAERIEAESTDGPEGSEAPSVTPTPGRTPNRRSTAPLIDRAIERLVRAGGRKSEADAAHLLESIAVVVYDPDKAAIDPAKPKSGTGLRWEEFVEALVASYRVRFED